MNVPGKKLLIGAAAAGVLTLGAWYMLGGRDSVQYRTTKLDRGEIAANISATGNCNAVVTVQVGSQVSGNINNLYADFNTKVKQGQLVARIDPAIFEAKVTQAQAALDITRANVLNMQSALKKAEADIASAKAAIQIAKANTAKAKVAVVDGDTKLKRRVEMFKQGLIASEDKDTAQATYDGAVAAWDAAKSQEEAAGSELNASIAARDVVGTQLAQADAQVKQAAANLTQAQVDLDHTYIRAPVDGTVVARHMDVGQVVAASFQAPTIFEIAQDLTRMKVDTNVDEADIGRVRLGQPVTFTVDAYPNQRFEGQVMEIRKAPNNVQNVITYDVVAAVSNSDMKLFPGMTANVKILTDRQESALRLPNAALRFRPPQAAPSTVHAAGRQDAGQAVYVLDVQGKPRRVRVKLGISDGMYTQVLDGDLHEGDPVILSASSGAGQKSAASGAGAGGMRRGPGF